MESQQAQSLFALPSEVRCMIYKALFNIIGTRTLRRLWDAKARRAPHIKLIDNAILRTGKTVCAEALPLFYASQKIHYSIDTNGLFHQPTFLKGHAGWIKRISIEVTINSRSSAKLDSIVATHIRGINKYCTTLSIFTLHVIPAIEPGDPPVIPLSHVFAQGIAAKALRTLRSRLQRLSIVTFGTWSELCSLRDAICDGDQWVEGDKWREWFTWPELRLTRAQDAAISVKQRRYTLVGSEDVIHPHKYCIRDFHLYRSKTEPKGMDIEV